jgi:hypothetical protein
MPLLVPLAEEPAQRLALPAPARLQRKRHAMTKRG